VLDHGHPRPQVHGITARDKLHKRVPTFSVTIESAILGWRAASRRMSSPRRISMPSSGRLGLAMRAAFCAWTLSLQHEAEIDRLCDVLGA
jgi:hypothetical protein